MPVVLAAIFALAGALQPPGALDARWTTRLDAPPAAGGGFDGASAYVPLKNGRLVAVDLETGLVRWSRPLATTWPPEAGDGLVFVSSGEAVRALDARTGEPRWATPLGASVAAPLSWEAGWLIVSTSSGDLVALRASDGQRIWQRALGSPLAARPGQAQDGLYVGVKDGRLLALTLATGEPQWARQLAGPVTGALALPEQIVVGMGGRRVVSVDPRSGRERWVWKVGGDVAGSPVADDRRIYFAARDNVIRAVDRRSGNLRWLASLPSRPAGGPVVVAGAVIVPSVSRELTGFDAATGRRALTVTAAGEIGAPPFLRRARESGPRLITLSLDGELQGFGIRFEPPPAPLAELPGTPAAP